ncbi:hypothetical protein SCCGRSA3_00016 [Marine Group I thaumarchaeote SCGC RSA3]|uniref:Uncharacterized protein n=1 Tax=Marine Group I thaumarchaeote SCGC RSA3 TaxID=1503183 RepID=A0A087S5K5_9ARCH|nr:hypothetical protein SCCGRSA3_00016 [Marine Group I thaumarchaeote SCGC RSA3]
MILFLIPTGIWIFAGVFCVLLYYTYRKQIHKKFKQNEYDESTIEEMR